MDKKNFRKLSETMLVITIIIASIGLNSQAGPIKIGKTQIIDRVLKSPGNNSSNGNNTNLSQLIVHTPGFVMEGEDFLVRVTADNISIVNATVTVDWCNGSNCSFFTDQNGSVILTAPFVDQPTNYTIWATKTGYLPGSASILVLDGNNISQLVVDVPRSVIEGQFFNVYVSADGFPIANASVDVPWVNISYYTNQNGSVTLRAPFVEFDTNFTILATKVGYLPGSASIIVLDYCYNCSFIAAGNALLIDKEPITP